METTANGTSPFRCGYGCRAPAGPDGTGLRWRSRGTTALTLITAANLIDMIPNSTLSPLGLLMLGALAAFVQFDIKGEAKATAEGPDAASHRQTRYTRFAPESRPETEALSRYRRF